MKCWGCGSELTTADPPGGTCRRCEDNRTRPHADVNDVRRGSDASAPNPVVSIRIESTPGDVYSRQSVFKMCCDALRRDCQSVEQRVRDMTPCVSGLPDGVEFQEVNAQLMLAVRHLEDARMRLGKAIQYGCDAGQSCYDNREPHVEPGGQQKGS